MAGTGPVPDRYRRLQLLGEGGAGQVWLVEDQFRRGAQLALKEPLEGPTARPGDLQREFVALSRLRHPGLVEALELDRGPSDGLPRFTLEFVDGEELAAVVAREGPATCLALAAEALRVIGFLHDFGLVHRDLKPDNLLVRRQPLRGCRLVLLDLGLAASEMQDEDARGRGPAGTLPYMAPEFFEGRPCTPRSDLYSLGALFYEVIHGHPPHELRGDDLARFVEAVREGRRTRPPLPPGYPDGLGTWIEELLSPDPAQRPPGARSALARLNGLTSSSFAVETAGCRAARLASDPPPGRSAECERLSSLLEPEAGPRLVWLTGPPGSGKSRLLHWLRGESILHGWTVYAPLSGLPTLAGPQQGTVRLSGLLAGLREQAAAGPTLLLLDEVEATDGMTARLLDRVAREGRAAPLQIVAALKPAEARHPLIRRLLEHTGTVPTLRSLELEPLGPAAVREMAERATGSREISEARLRWLARASDGVAEQAESLLVEGVWEKGGKGRRPAEVEHAWVVRARNLRDETRGWLVALAVAGPDSAESDLARLAGLEDGPPSRRAADEARSAGLAADHEGRWSLTSRALGGHLRESLEPARAAELHRRAAELFEKRETDTATSWRLARLWGGAGESGPASEHAVLAAERSLADGDPVEAAERYAFALRHCPRGSPRRLALRVEQAEALMRSGRFQDAARAFGAALRLAPDPATRAGLLGRQAHALAHAGRFSRAREAAEEARQLARGPELVPDRAQALKALGLVLGRLGREDEAIPFLQESLQAFRQAGDVEMEAETLQTLATCRSRIPGGNAEEDFHRSIGLFRELGHHASVAKSLAGLAVLQMREGNLAEAQSLLEEVRTLAQEHGHLDLQETALSKLAALCIEQGRLDRAIAQGREALDLARHLADENRMMIDRCRLAEAFIVSGAPANAVDLLREGLETPLETVEPDSVDYARLLLAQGLAETPGFAEDDVRLLLVTARRGFRERRKTRPLVISLVQEMELVCARGPVAAFDPLWGELEALCSAAGAEVEPEIRIRADLARATALIHRGATDDARETAHRAAEAARRCDQAAYRARALGLMGEALERLGRPDEAGQAFREAVRLLDAAAERIEDAATRRTYLERGVHGAVRERDPALPKADAKRLLALYEMIRALNSESDPDILLDSILDMALRAVSAERGMILLREESGDGFAVRRSRNLERETVEDAEGFSRGIVAQAGAGRSILSLQADDDERFRDLKSVSMYGIRSLMCVPLRSRGAIVGTVYLDSRSEGALFDRDDLRFVEAFADHAALALQNARERADLRRENSRLRAAVGSRTRLGDLVGRSAAMQRVYDLIEKFAPSDLPVLIHGESGTGKELVARAIHFNGPRRQEIILTENCAAIPETLLESELFGHVRGAFTGADRDRQGLFEQADGGTLFLDEVGDMSPGMQARLLRALQEGEIRRVGADRPIRVDVRVIAATHRDLGEEVREGRFREDLLYRLQVLNVPILPIRERREDIPLLIDHLLDRIARERGRGKPRIETDVLTLLERYSWPGNVRQLESALQRLVLLAGESPITRTVLESDESLRDALLPEAADGPEISLAQGVREQLRRALAASGGHRERAAKLLGISRATLYRKLKQHGIS